MEEPIVPSRDRQALIRQRTCAHCGVTKPLNDDCFPRKIQRKTGYRGYCLKCEKRKKSAR